MLHFSLVFGVSVKTNETNITSGKCTRGQIKQESKNTR